MRLQRFANPIEEEYLMAEAQASKNPNNILYGNGISAATSTGKDMNYTLGENVPTATLSNFNNTAKDPNVVLGSSVQQTPTSTTKNPNTTLGSSIASQATATNKSQNNYVYNTGNIYADAERGYTESINDYNRKIAEQEAEKQRLIDEYNNYYNEQLGRYDELTEQQRALIDNWANTQREQQERATQYELDLINQSKEDAAKQTKAEQSNAYIDYQRGLNEFGGSSEQLAARGVSGTGFAKNQDIAMNIAYQNRVSTANAALMKSNREFDNQIQQALLTKDANLAQLAYQQMQQQYELALNGFEYKSNLWNQKLAYEQEINNTYFNRVYNYQQLIKNYQDSINANRKAKQEQANWEKQFKENQRQFNAQMSLQRQKAAAQAAAAKQQQFTDGSGNKSSEQLLNTKTTLNPDNFSSKSAFSNYNLLETTVKKNGGISKSELESTLKTMQSKGQIKSSDVSVIKKHFGI